MSFKARLKAARLVVLRMSGSNAFHTLDRPQRKLVLRTTFLVRETLYRLQAAAPRLFCPASDDNGVHYFADIGRALARHCSVPDDTSIGSQCISISIPVITRTKTGH